MMLRNDFCTGSTHLYRQGVGQTVWNEQNFAEYVSYEWMGPEIRAFGVFAEVARLMRYTLSFAVATQGQHFTHLN
jgi:hypothetical protein